MVKAITISHGLGKKQQWQQGNWWENGGHNKCCDRDRICGRISLLNKLFFQWKKTLSGFSRNFVDVMVCARSVDFGFGSDVPFGYLDLRSSCHYARAHREKLWWKVLIWLRPCGLTTSVSNQPCFLVWENRQVTTINYLMGSSHLRDQWFILS